VNGFRLLLGKELREAWRTRRLPVVALLFIAVGIISPLTAKYLAEIVKLAAGDQLPLPIPPADAVTAVGQLQKNLGQLGALTAIGLAMGSVSGELDRGTAALVLAQPIGRPAFLLAKLAGVGLVLGISLALGIVAAWIYTAILFVPLPLAGWIAFAILSWLALFAWAALTLLASTATGSTTAAAGIGFVALIAVSLLAAIPAVDHVLPTGLAAPAALLALGRGAEIDGAQLVTAGVGSIAIVALAAAAAVGSFANREL
jgi:ABC-2 type transport system permease protein